MVRGYKYSVHALFFIPATNPLPSSFATMPLTRLVPIALLALFSVTSAAPTVANNGIHWGPCSKDSPYAEQYAAAEVPIECGFVALPLDYTDKTMNQTYNASIIKIPASTQPAKGSIMFNFGGPGGPAQASLIGTAPVYQA